MIRGWCGKPCAECTNPCALDERIPCSPDCECLGEHGEYTDGCKDCEVYIDFKKSFASPEAD